MVCHYTCLKNPKIEHGRARSKITFSLDINKVLNEWDERLSALSMIRTETATQQIESRHQHHCINVNTRPQTHERFVRLRVGIKGLHIYEELWKVSGDEKPI